MRNNHNGQQKIKNAVQKHEHHAINVESIRCYMIRVAGKLLTGSRQLTVASNKEHLYQTEWDAWLELGDCL